MTIRVLRTFRQTSSKYYGRLPPPVSPSFFNNLFPSFERKYRELVSLKEICPDRQWDCGAGELSCICWILITNSWFNLSVRRMLSSLSCFSSQNPRNLTLKETRARAALWSTKNKLTRRHLCFFQGNQVDKNLNQPGRGRLSSFTVISGSWSRYISPD